MDLRTNRIAPKIPAKPSSTGTLRGVLSFVTLLLMFALAFGWSLAQASGTLIPSEASLSGPLAQATAPGDFPTVPQPAASGVPAAEPSAANPNANSDLPPGQQPAQPSSNATSPSSSGGFPWLIILILLIVAVLGVVAVLLMRSRRTMQAAGGPMIDAPPASRTRPPATVVPAATMPVASSAPAVVPAPVTTPSTLTCPNCSAVNDWNENFCHDCGQDLRPVRASVIASMAPPADAVTDDMPYLETLDRSDEQLEYVLSRRRVVVGSAAGCDIMVDKAFAGSSTVAPRHAQLSRNDDGSFSVTDLGAPSGTFVNDTRVEANGSAPLSDGAQVRVGSVRFVYRVPGA